MNLLKRTLRLLLSDERRQALRVMGAVFVSALLDFVGLASLLPILYLLLGEQGDRSMVLFFCLIALVVVTLKGLISTFLLRLQHRFLLSLYKRLSLSLFDTYYRRGLLFIREQGSSRLVFEVNNVCFAFSQSILMPLLRMAADFILLFLVSVAFLIYDAYSMMILYATFIPFVVVYLILIRQRIVRHGKEEQQAKREQARTAGEVFRGYAEVEVYGAFPHLCERFRDGIDAVSDSRMQLMNLQRVPMWLTELSVIIGLALLALTTHGDARLVVGGFALVAIRLLPAVRHLMTGWTQIQHASFCLDILEESLTPDTAEASVQPSTACPFQHEISFSHLCYAYPEGKPVIDDFNAAVRKGEWVGISGQSGVGKSTLFNLLLGFLTPTEGEIRIDGKVLDTEHRQSWLRRVGYVSQEVFIFDATLAENIACGSSAIDLQLMEQVMRQVSLDRWLDELPQRFDTPLNECGNRLSGGQRQRIGIARALYKQADVLLLDEATSALDTVTEQEINDTLITLHQQCPDITILHIAHHPSALALCDRVIEMEINGDKRR